MKKNTFLKTALALSFALSVQAAGAADHDTIYISPNNDGVQDVLEVPIAVKDRRYVVEWSFFIYDSNGIPVRVISNKEKRTGRLTFKTFIKALFSAKKGVEIPKSVSWNGALDDGSLAPDGTYYYAFTATDDNGNSSSSEKLCVIVDNTPPSVELAELADEDKVFGEGAKSELRVEQTGSEEDVWSAKIVDSLGKTVWQKKWEDKNQKAQPLTIDWDGTGLDENGVITGFVPDGVYSYSIESTDRAGNKSAPAEIKNIIYSSVKPVTNIAISGSRYFSPNTGSELKNISFDVSIPAPDGVTNKGAKLTNWSIAIVGQDGKEYRRFEGTDAAPSKMVFDGSKASLEPAVVIKGNDKSDSIPDGTYQAVVTARYQNGYETAPMNSPAFVKDTNVPKATLSVSNTLFSPDGDGKLDTVTISQKVTKPEASWTGRILDENKKVIKEFDLGQNPADSVAWDGLDSNGMLASDGKYTYELVAIDQAGNKGKASSTPFSLDTSNTELLLSVTPTYFSPIGKKNTVVLTPKANEKSEGSKVISYTLEISGSDGNVVRTIKADKSLPATITWNGYSDANELCADGVYTAKLSTVAANENTAETSSQPFTIDTVPPAVELQAPERMIFDSTINPFTIGSTSSTETKWTGSLVDSSGKTVRTYEWKENVPESLDWDGTDESGNAVPDGLYKFIVSAEDEAGNATSVEMGGINLDTREAKAYVTASLSGFSPNGDKVKDEQLFNIRASLQDGMDSWEFYVADKNGNPIRTWSGDASTPLPQNITWDGKTDKGGTAEGEFTGNIKLSYTKGNKVAASTSPFICTTLPPIAVVKTAPEYFSPDNDGENDDLSIQLSAESKAPLSSWSFVISEVDDKGREKPFWETSGKSAITPLILWDGRSSKNGDLVQSATDYPYTFTVTDSLGMTTVHEGVIQVDVLVIRDGNKLKMQVPSIIFRGDRADFASVAEVAKMSKEEQLHKGLDQKTVDNNIRVLKRVSQILKKFKDYNVTIEGNANNLSGTQKEENTEVLPLTQARAEFILNWLNEKGGISKSRLKAVGNGSKSPLVNMRDVDNRWKNRRVEFVLVK